MALLRHRHHWLGFLLRSQTTLGCTASRPGTHSNPVTSTFSCQRSYSIVKPGRVSPHRKVPIHIKKPPYAGWLKRMPKKTKDVEIKTDDQILAMRESCAVARDILQLAGEKARVGVSTDEIDEFVHSLCIEKGVYPSPLHYRGFPKSICTSVNNVACHGIPDDRPLEDGDIVNIDITVFHKGFHGDTSSMFLVGNVDSKGHTLVEAARRCRDEAIAMCGPGIPLHYIGCTISQICEEIHMDVIPQFCGHGIGTYFHGPPDIFHFANEMNGVMKSGTIFTIEPIITEGLPPIRILEDDWTAISEDNSRSAQFEHTILITENGAEILT